MEAKQRRGGGHRKTKKVVTRPVTHVRYGEPYVKDNSYIFFIIKIHSRQKNAL
jgi:hypothetical protein